MRINKNDIILIVSVLVISAIIFSVFLLTLEKGESVKIIQNDKTEILSLNQDTKKIIKTSDGCYNTLIINDGKAYIESASCPDKICVSHRAISKIGETIVCLPHKLVIEIA